MLYLIYGDDFKKTRERLNTLIEDLSNKKPDISLIKIDEDNISDYDISGFFHRQGLFEKEILVIFDHILNVEPLDHDVEKILPKMAESKNTFLIHEGLLSKKIVDIVKEEGGQIEKFIIKKIEKNIFNPFSLGDTLGEKNRKKLWISFYKAISAGLSVEEIHGILFWQIKSIMVAKKSKNINESGLNPYVFGKAKRFSLKYKTEELKKMLENLVDIYHDSRMGLTELPVALEKFILRI